MRAFDQTTRSVATSQERLASGMRINKASDDAAGLAISESLNTDSRVYAQGVRNVNDGMSALTIAESAIEELSGIVVRVRELATQSANGAISDTQRASLDEEAQALSKEFTRIQQSTEFNSIGLLNGESDGVTVQAGYGTDGMIKAGIGGLIGEGTFKDAVDIAGTGGSTHTTAIADMNNDGNNDVLHATTGGFAIQFGNGNGSFGTSTSYNLGMAVSVAAPVDLNGDGNLDVVATNYANGKVSVLLGNGNGTFGASVSYAAGSAPVMQPEFGDLNGDGDLDMVVSAITSGTTQVFIGNGNGTFQDTVSYSVGSNTHSVALGDFDNNGVLDMVASQRSASNNVHVFMGNGDGSFQSDTSFSAGNGATNVQAIDLNQDGNLDLVTANENSDDITVMLGNGNGNFQSAVAYEAGDGARHVEFGDFNADGMLDAAVANVGSHDISILAGNGDGTFQEAITHTAGNDPLALTIGDLNGDDVADIAVGGYDPDVQVLYGNTRGGVSPLEEFSLKTRSGALTAMSPLDQKLDKLNSQRGEIGASQARLTVASNVLSVSTENYKAAEGRIRDADIASESANLVRNQILQQASAAVLAQANQQPALALQLLS